MVPHTKISRQIWLLVLLVLSVSACHPLVPSAQLPIAQPTSPLIPGKTLGLVNARWQVREIIYQDQVIVFDAIQPIRVEMGVEGYLQVRMTGCNTITFRMAAESDRHYQLVDGVVTLMECPEPANSQTGDVFNAFVATTELELVGTQLRLTGVSTRIVLEPLRPMLPGDDALLTQGPWHVSQITQQGQVLDLNAIQPITVEITVEGYLTAKTTGCNTLTFWISAKDERQYQYYDSSPTMEACSDTASLQTHDLFIALINTHEMVIKDGQLLLTGELVEMVLER